MRLGQQRVGEETLKCWNGTRQGADFLLHIQVRVDGQKRLRELLTLEFWVASRMLLAFSRVNTEGIESICIKHLPFKDSSCGGRIFSFVYRNCSGWRVLAWVTGDLSPLYHADLDHFEREAGK